MPVAQFSSESLRQSRQPDLERVGFSLAGRGLAVLVTLLLFCAFTSAGCGFTSNNPAKQIKLAPTRFFA